MLRAKAFLRKCRLSTGKHNNWSVCSDNIEGSDSRKQLVTAVSDEDVSDAQMTQTSGKFSAANQRQKNRKQKRGDCVVTDEYKQSLQQRIYNNSAPPMRFQVSREWIHLKLDGDLTSASGIVQPSLFHGDEAMKYATY